VARIDVFTALDHHEAIRVRGIPQISLLSGAPWHAPALLRAWLWERRRALVVQNQLDAVALECAWVQKILDEGTLGPAVHRLLGAPDLSVRGEQEFQIFMNGALESVAPSLRPLCRIVMTHAWHGTAAIAAPLLAALDAEASPRPRAWVHGDGLALAAMPAVLLASDDCDLGWLESAAQLALSIVEAAPAMTLTVAVPPEIEAAYWDAAPESRARALLREGLIVSQVERAWPRPSLEIRAEAQPVLSDGARSEAERFLFHALEQRSETKGRFVLNGVVPLPLAQGHAEVDLLAAELRIAIELDGYFHFQSDDTYRRDRRKDLALQRAGFVVLRFLAEDVVSRLEEIWENIRTVVAERA
jgi:very-short-patch-repair endonuclease